MSDEPPLDDRERRLYVVPQGEVDPSQDIVIPARLPPLPWPWILGGAAVAVVTGFVAVAALTGASSQPVTPGRVATVTTQVVPGPASTAPTTPSKAPPPFTPTVPVASPADLGKLTQAMRGEAVKVERPAPTPLDAATAAISGPSPSDANPPPPTAPTAPPHDVALGIVAPDAAPAALPLEQSLLSPTPTADAPTTSGRQPVRIVWDSVASGTPEQVAAIDRAGELVEQDDVSMARDVLRPCVAAGNAVATFAMAQTYDPASLQAWKASSAVPDAGKARTFYRQALAGGVEAARARLAALR